MRLTAKQVSLIVFKKKKLVELQKTLQTGRHIVIQKHLDKFDMIEIVPQTECIENAP